ncbi:MAG: NUDIX hydrolase N-terminal domain-containing protein [Ginsengibacter sp.]
MNQELLEEIKRLKSIADLGLLYCDNEYNKERYTELLEISFRLLSKVSGQDIAIFKENFPVAKDYPTAKVDIRGMVLSPEKKILLVKERADNKWSLPGGWADIGYSPKEVIVKEFKEETGLDVIPETLLAVFDKRMHAHPAQPLYIYKVAFYCKAISSQSDIGFDILDINYFDINNLPELSETRILKSQIELLYKKVIESDWKTYFD